MYLEYFGLRETPFSLTPDPEFFFNWSGCQQALDKVTYALRSGEGLMKVVGEVGTGKTLLCRTLIQSLQDSYRTVYLPNPMLGPLEMLRAIAAGLGCRAGEESLGALQQRVTRVAENCHRNGGGVLVCIDEAQGISDVGLESLRLLSNIETEKRKLIQIVLFAQPELDRRLEQKQLRQLRQRISFACRLQPLDRQGTAAYVNHRLKVAGFGADSPFTNTALDHIYRAANGIPRLVNILAHKSLLVAFDRRARVVEKVHVRAAAEDTAQAQFSWRSMRPSRLIWGIGLVTLAEVALIIAWISFG